MVVDVYGLKGWVKVVVYVDVGCGGDVLFNVCCWWLECGVEWFFVCIM